MTDVTGVSVSVGDDLFHGHAVQRVECCERLFETYEVVVALHVGEAFDTDEAIGRPASVRLETTRGPRAWHGLVWSGRLAPRIEGDHALELRIRPRVALLALGMDSRVFQERSVRAIADDVLSRAGLAPDCWAWELEEELRAHVNVTQRAESDEAFLRRLLAEEGVTFALHNDESHEVLRLFDSARGFLRRDELSSLQVGHVVDHSRDGAWDLRERLRVTSDGVAARDHDPRRPTEERMHTAGGHLQHYVHAAGFDEPREGRRRAERWRDALVWPRRVLSGRCNVPFLEAGTLVGLDGHDRAGASGTFALVAVEHVCARDASDHAAWSYEARFEAIPEGTIHRPDWRPTRHAGLERALVTTPAGQDNHFDEEGEVKVRYLWDRAGITDDRSSTWCRVGQMQLPGPMVLPRTGFSVLVSAEQDDLDRPLVVGHAYDAEHHAPYATPAHAARSSWQSATLDSGPGVNELRFDDTAGAEEVLFNASMTLREVVEHDAVRRVTCNESVLVGMWQSLSVAQDSVSAVGALRTTLVGHDQRARIEEHFTEGVGGDERTTCQRRRLRVGQDSTQTVGGREERSVGVLDVVGALESYSHRVLQSSTTSAGTLWAETVVGNKTSSVRGDRTETVSALRAIEAGSLRVRASGGIDETLGELSLEVEGDRVMRSGSSHVCESQAALTVVADTVSITGSSQLSLTGGSCTITLEPSGRVTLEAPRVNLRNCESLGSAVRVN